MAAINPSAMQRWNRRIGATMVLVAAALLVTICGVVVSASPVDAQEPGFSIEHGRLLDANGNDFVLRGINHPHAWFPAEVASLGDIKAAGANSVRLVVSSGDLFARTGADELSQLIEACRAHRLVCVLELHDTTGYLEIDNAISLQAAADYWIEMAPALVGQEAYVIVNLGNEPFGNVGYERWESATTSAIAAMRAAGLHHTLMVDAPNWGQDISRTMSRDARSVLKNDPAHNVIFSVHMFGVFERASSVRSYIEDFMRAELPLVIAEFGATHTSGDPDEDAIMSWAQAYGIGYMAWSWSGNRAPVPELNVVEQFDPMQLTPWGSRLVNGANGLKETSVEASIFGRVIPRPPARIQPLLQAPLRDPFEGLVDRAEAEDGVRNGVQASLKGAGFSGGGYVNDFSATGDSLTVTLDVDHTDVYDLHVGYRAQYGDKLQRLYVNGVFVADMRFGRSTNFTSLVQPDIFLEAGTNTVMIASDWGWIDLDYFEVRTTVQT